jgi:GNAT superfamily N-acetyltransferase
MELITETFVRVRRMTVEDVAPARELSRQQKWPHRTSDWEFLFQNGSGFVADRDGKVVGTIMFWNNGADAATLGMVIVSPPCQGEGIGSRLMETALDVLGDRTVLLYSTDQGKPLYERFGFQTLGAVLQHQGTVKTVPLAELRPDERVRPMGRNDRGSIEELDRLASGADRGALMSVILESAKGVMFDSNGETVGFSLMRRFGRGFVVGPTIAPDAIAAKALISHWLGIRSGRFCRLDVPEDSGLSAWLAERGLPCVKQATIMVRGKPLNPSRPGTCFSLISQALG